MEKKKEKPKESQKLNNPSEGAGVFDTVVGTAVDRFVEWTALDGAQGG